MDKVKTIVSKEWAEVFKNRLVLFTVAFLPLIFIILPIATLVAINSFDDGSSMSTADEMPEELVGDLCVDMEEADCVQAYMLNLYTLMFMILPVAIPATIAAYSIVGEKTSRSLEPLLATPITTTELLAGKTIAAFVPAVGATWLAFLIYVVTARFMVNDVVFAQVIAPEWLIAIFVVGPLLTITAVSVAVMVSSRVSDPRVAEQLSALVIMPLILLIVGQSMGLILVNQTMIWVMAAVTAVLDVVLVYLAIQLFQRETILTRWK